MFIDAPVHYYAEYCMLCIDYYDRDTENATECKSTPKVVYEQDQVYQEYEKRMENDFERFSLDLAVDIVPPFTVPPRHIAILELSAFNHKPWVCVILGVVL